MRVPIQPVMATTTGMPAPRENGRNPCDKSPVRSSQFLEGMAGQCPARLQTFWFIWALLELQPTCAGKATSSLLPRKECAPDVVYGRKTQCGGMAMHSAALDDLTVAEIMSEWPPTIRVFLSRRMHCVGCPISPFHTLVDAAREHGLSLDDLIEAVSAAIDSAPTAGRNRRIHLAVGEQQRFSALVEVASGLRFESERSTAGQGPCHRQ